MKWPWQRRIEDPTPDVNEAAVAYVQAGVQTAVNDLNRSLSMLDLTLKSMTPTEKKVHAHV